MRALAFPYGVDRNGRTRTLEDDADVAALIEQVLFTAPGERVNRPDFGAGLQHLVFAPGGERLLAAVGPLAQGALQQWLGDLILVEAVDVTAEEGTLIVSLRYMLRRDRSSRALTITRGAS